MTELLADSFGVGGLGQVEPKAGTPAPARRPRLFGDGEAADEPLGVDEDDTLPTVLPGGAQFNADWQEQVAFAEEAAQPAAAGAPRP